MMLAVRQINAEESLLTGLELTIFFNCTNYCSLDD